MKTYSLTTETHSAFETTESGIEHKALLTFSFPTQQTISLLLYRIQVYQQLGAQLAHVGNTSLSQEMLPSPKHIIN